MSQDPKPCELCKRLMPRLTVHHLIPRTRHRNRRNKREFDRLEVRERTAMLCRPCHNNVHAVLTEKQLEREFNTIELLAVHPEVVRFTEWIANRPPDTRVPTRQSKSRKRPWSR